MRFLSVDNFITTGIILLIMNFFSVIFNIDFLDKVNNTISDFKVTDIVFSRMRNENKINIDTNIVIVNIGELKRDSIAEEINIINNYHPKVIGVDVFFKVEKGPDYDIPLAEALSKIENLVLVSRLIYNEDDDSFKEMTKSIPMFDKYAKTGFANFVEDEYRTIREFSPSENTGKQEENAFAVIISKIYNPEAVNRLTSRKNSTETIYYERNLDKYRVLDCNEIFEKKDKLNFIKDKIVLLGYMGPDFKTLSTDDNFYTPLNKQYIGKSYPDMYGIVIHANIISMILNGKYIESMPNWLVILLLVIQIYLSMTVFSYLYKKHEDAYESLSLLIIMAELALLFFVTFEAFYLFNYMMDLKPLFFALVLFEMVFESYNGSIKPLLIKAYKKIIHKTIKK